MDWESNGTVFKMVRLNFNCRLLGHLNTEILIILLSFVEDLSKPTMFMCVDDTAAALLVVRLHSVAPCEVTGKSNLLFQRNWQGAIKSTLMFLCGSGVIIELILCH